MKQLVLIKNLDKTLNGGESCVLNKRVTERLETRRRESNRNAIKQSMIMKS